MKDVKDDRDDRDDRDRDDERGAHENGRDDDDRKGMANPEHSGFLEADELFSESLRPVEDELDTAE